MCVIYWFHPLVWVCWRALRREAERACDDAVVAVYEGTAYAEQLLRIARRQGERPLSSLPAMARRGELAVRVHAVLDRRQRRGRVGPGRAATLVVVAWACAVVISPVTPVFVAASHADDPDAVTFSSVSVRPSTSGQPMTMRSLPGGAVRITGAPLRALVRLAYGVQDHAILDAPAWMASQRFDVDATSEAGASPAMVLQMMRALLAEQFGLRVQQVVLTRPVFTLARSRLHGTQRQRSMGCQAALAMWQERSVSRVGTARPPCGFRVGHGRIDATGVDLHSLAATLSTPLGRLVVVDAPSSGPFDVALTWNAASDDRARALAEAVETQLGLSVLDQQRPVPVIVIRAVHRPA